MNRHVLLALALLVVIGQAFAWWDPAWVYRRAITITNDTGSTLTDFQVRVVVDTATPISEGKMSSDCSDMRFVDSDDATELPYWIEGPCNDSQTVVWVKVPEIPAGGTTIYMYYGNPSATSESNGVAVFEFFDNFDTNTIGTTWIEESAGICTISGSILYCDSSGTALYTSKTFTPPIRLVAKVNFNSAQSKLIGFRNEPTTYYPEAVFYTSGTPDYRLAYLDASATSTSYVFSTTVPSWDRIIIDWGTTQICGESSIYGSACITPTSIDTNALPIAVVDYDGTAGVTIDVDYVAVAKLADPEPTATVSSIEESSEQSVGRGFGQALPYWIESNGTPTKVWVKIPYIPPGGDIVLYAARIGGYIPSAQDTFDYWTAFTGSTLPAGWTCLQGVCTMTGDYVEVTGTDSETVYLVNDTAFSGPVTIEANIYIYGANPGTAGYGADFRLQANNTTAYPTDLVIPLGWYSTGSQYFWQTEANLNWSAKHPVSYSPSWIVSTVKWVPSEEVNIYHNYSLVGTETSIVPDDPLYYVVFSKPESYVRVAWVRVRKYAPEEPEVTVTPDGVGYKIIVHNPNSTALTNYQVAIPASDLGVSSPYASIAFTPLTLTIEHSPTELNELALDPQSGINSVEVNYIVDINAEGLEITEVNIEGTTYTANGAPVRATWKGAVGLSANGLVLGGDGYVYTNYFYPASGEVSMYVDFTIADDYNVDDAYVATVVGDSSLEFGVRIHQGNIEVVATGTGQEPYREPAVAGERYRFLLENGPNGYRVWKISDSGATLVYTAPKGTGFENEAVLFGVYSPSATDPRMYFKGIVHEWIVWERELNADEVQAFAAGKLPDSPTVYTHLRGGYYSDPYLYIYQAAVFPTQFSKTYTEVGDYNTCVSVKGYDGGGSEYNTEACTTVHIDMYPQVDFDWAPKIPFPSETITFTGQATDNGTLTYLWSIQPIDYNLYNESYLGNTGLAGASTEDIFSNKNGGVIILPPQTIEIGMTNGENVNVYVYISLDGVNYDLCVSGTTPDADVKHFQIDRYCIGKYVKIVLEPTYSSTYIWRVHFDQDNNAGISLTSKEGANTSTYAHEKIVIESAPPIYTLEDGSEIEANTTEIGTYPVTLTVTDDVGLSKSVTKDVYIYRYPTIVNKRYNSVWEGTIIPEESLAVIDANWNLTDLNIVVFGNPATYSDINDLPHGEVNYIIKSLVDGSTRELNDTLAWAETEYNIITGFNTDLNRTVEVNREATLECNVIYDSNTFELPESNEFNIILHKRNVIGVVCKKDNKEVNVIDDFNLAIVHILPRDEETGVYDLNLWKDVITNELPLFRFTAYKKGTLEDSYIYEDINEELYFVGEPDVPYKLGFEVHYTDHTYTTYYDLEYAPDELLVCVPGHTQFVEQIALATNPLDAVFAVTRADSGCIKVISEAEYTGGEGYGFRFQTIAGHYGIWVLQPDWDHKVLLSTFDGGSQITLDLDRMLLLVRKALPTPIPFGKLYIEHIQENNYDATRFRFVVNEKLKTFELNVYLDSNHDVPILSQKVYDSNDVDIILIWATVDINESTKLFIKYRGIGESGWVYEDAFTTYPTGRVVRYPWYLVVLILATLGVLLFIRPLSTWAVFIMSILYVLAAVMLIPYTDITPEVQMVGLWAALALFLIIMIGSKIH